MFKDVLLPLFIQYGLPVLITAALIPLAKAVWSKVSAFLAAKTEESKENKAAAFGYRVLTSTSELIAAIVADLNSTMKAELLAASADGKITAEEGAALKAHAMERVKAVLAEKGRAELFELFGSLADTFLSGAIEKAVSEQKTSPQ